LAVPARAPCLCYGAPNAETGVAGYDVQGLFGLMLPAGAARDIVMRLNADSAKVLAAVLYCIERQLNRGWPRGSELTRTFRARRKH
jgi:hypothetical protein